MNEIDTDKEIDKFFTRLSNQANKTVKTSKQSIAESNELFQERRKGSVAKAKHQIFIGSIYIFWGLVLLTIIVRFVHLILPSYCAWMSSDQVQNLDNLLFSGIFGGILGKYGHKIIDD